MLRTLALVSFVLFSACGSSPVGPECRTTADCMAGRTCVDSRCVMRAEVDAGDDDAATGDDAGDCPVARVCGESCCAAGETCGGGACCAPAELCGGACCPADHSCVADACVLDCAEDRSPCTVEGADVCCDAGDLCYLGACVTPGAECSGARDCADGEYCEPTAGRCLPRATGEVCEYMPPVGEFTLTEEWAWTGDAEVRPTSNQVMMAPMVANLTDDNGDGLIDENDIPDVIFHTFLGSDYWSSGTLRAISGDDGARIWPTSEANAVNTAPGGEVAIAELDASSEGPEIVACSPAARPSSPGHLMIVSAAGTVLRRFDTAPNDVPCGFDAPAIGDMDGDGTPEILVRYVIAHADGTVVTRIRANAAASGRYNTLADIDGDDDLEVVAGDGAWNLDGSEVWTGGIGAAWIAIADIDLDDEPEIVAIGGGHFIHAMDAATGAMEWGPIDINPPELAAVIAADGRPNGGGPPTIANFDDDPNPEIAFAGGFAYVIFEHDGTRKWFEETQDRSSRSTGSSIFDFEGDGVAEVLYNDELQLRVFRGPDGALFHNGCNTSGTLREYPIVVDVDNDDHAEIILMANNYAFRTCMDGSSSGTGIRAFGHPENQWVRTRRIWNQHTYHVTNVEEDGTIPRREERNWTNPRLNNFRQNVQPDGLFDAPDLVLADLRASTGDCPLGLALSVRVVNRGSAGAPAGVPVTFYEVSGDTRVFVGRAPTTRPLLPGESELVALPGGFTLPEDRRGDTYSFEAVLNDPDDMPLVGFHQCRTENDGTGPVEGRCPIVE